MNKIACFENFKKIKQIMRNFQKLNYNKNRQDSYHSSHQNCLYSYMIQI